MIRIPNNDIPTHLMTPSVSVVAIRLPLGENLQRVMGAECPLYVSLEIGMKGVEPSDTANMHVNKYMQHVRLCGPNFCPLQEGY